MTDLHFWKQYVPEIDLSEDEPWRPMFNPYRGKATPGWLITAEARSRIELRAVNGQQQKVTQETK